MVFYLFLFCLIFLFSFLYSHTKNKIVAVFPLTVTFLLFVIPSSFRAEGIGTDYFNYKANFYEIAHGVDISSQWWEPGYYYLNLFIYKIGFDYHVIFAIMSFFTILFLFLSVSKRTFGIIIPIYAFTNYLFTYNGIRQGLTITMGFYAYTLYQKKKYVSAFIILGIGYLFHKSIIFLIPIILIMNFIKIDRKWSVIFFIVLIVVVKLFGMDIIAWGYTNVLEVLGYGGKLSDVMSYFLVKSNTGYGVLLRIGIYFVMLYLINNIRNINKLKENFLYKARFFLLLYFFMDIFHVWTVQEIGRLKMVYDFALFIPLATIYNYSKYRKLFFIGYFLWLMMNLYLSSTGIQNPNNAFPYKSLLF